VTQQTVELPIVENVVRALRGNRLDLPFAIPHGFRVESFRVIAEDDVAEAEKALHAQDNLIKEAVEALTEARAFVVIQGPAAAFPDVIAKLDAILTKLTGEKQ
jgi:hypothetical protein